MQKAIPKVCSARHTHTYILWHQNINFSINSRTGIPRETRNAHMGTLERLLFFKQTTHSTHTSITTHNPRRRHVCNIFFMIRHCAKDSARSAYFKNSMRIKSYVCVKFKLRLGSEFLLFFAFVVPYNIYTMYTYMYVYGKTYPSFEKGCCISSLNARAAHHYLPSNLSETRVLFNCASNDIAWKCIRHHLQRRAGGETLRSRYMVHESIDRNIWAWPCVCMVACRPL